ncbi:Cytochrome P450 736A117 [Linum perenne]
MIHQKQLLQDFFFSNPLPLLPILILTLIITTKRLFSSSKSTSSNLPPSPWKLPILGNLHQLGTHPHRTLQSLAQKHGPLMLLHLGSSPTLVASSASSAKQIMKTHDLVFANRPYSSIQNRLLYNYKDLSQAPYGEYWRQLRSICVLRLLSAKRVESFRSIREQEAELLVEKIGTMGLLGFDLGEMLAAVTNNVVCRVAFGRKYGEGNKGKEFKKLLEDFGAALGIVNVGDFVPWLGWINRFNGVNEMVERVFWEFDKFLDEVVEDHRCGIGSIEEKSEDEKDLVDVLLQMQRESESPDSAIDGDSIKAILLDMFAAGSDTSYTALEWTMTEILRNPSVMKKLQQEIRTITGNNRNVTEDDIKQMTYLKAVIKESFRLHPPIPILVPRESTRDVTVQGYDVAAKTRVLINAWAIGRDPKNWDEPEEFRPERFLNSSIDFKGQDFELIPFGAGRRGCPGISFATASIEITLACLLQRFDWSLPGGRKAEDLDADEAPGLAVHRKTPLVVVATPWAP